MAKVYPLAHNNKRQSRQGSCNSCRSKSGPPLDTLAQGGTNSKTVLLDDAVDLDFDIVGSTNTDDKKSLIKRSRRKNFNDSLIPRLVEASDQNPLSYRSKSYWNTYHCASSMIHYSDGKTRANYCKNRWCMVCNSIRTAQLINTYSHIIESWGDRYFVTLTLPTVPRLDLKESIAVRGRVLSKCLGTIKKRHQRGKAPKLEGIWKMECTYRPQSDEYHPHYHVIIRSKSNAYLLRDMWLKNFRSADIKAQDVRRATMGDAKELFKYFTKLVSSTGKKVAPGARIDSRSIYADAMDVIFNAMKGRQTFKPFGFKKSDYPDPPSSEEEEIHTGDVENEPFAIGESVWNRNAKDWVNEDTGELLSGYIPGESFQEFLDTRIIVRPGYDGIHWRKYSSENESGKGKRLRFGWMPKE